MSRTVTTFALLLPRLAASLAAVLLCGLALRPLPAAAETSPPDESRLVAAKAVIDSSGGRAETLKYLNQMRATLVAQLRNQDPGKAEKAEKNLDTFITEANPRFAAYLDEMQGLAINFYATSFSTDELKTIATFQASEAGKKLRAAVPELSAAMAAPMFRFQHELMTEMQKP